MSPINVHVTRYPLSGNIIYSKYHAGKYLVAWHPKSSTKNERTTIVVDNEIFGKVLYRQIAGAVARRIKHTYLNSFVFEKFGLIYLFNYNNFTIYRR
jgi:phosphatidylserine decarboxylase